MGTDPVANQNEGSPQHEEEPSLVAGSGGDDGGSHDGGFAASDAPTSADAADASQAAEGAASSPEADLVPFAGDTADAPVAGTGDLLADNDLLAAVTSMSSDPIFNVEHTLDQLTTSSDLFDVPAVDFHDVLPS